MDRQLLLLHQGLTILLVPPSSSLADDSLHNSDKNKPVCRLLVNKPLTSGSEGIQRNITILLSAHPVPQISQRPSVLDIVLQGKARWCLPTYLPLKCSVIITSNLYFALLIIDTIVALFVFYTGLERSRKVVMCVKFIHETYMLSPVCFSCRQTDTKH